MKTKIRIPVIKVPDIHHLTRCYKQCNPKPNQPELFDRAMHRCMFKRGHSGPHQWALGPKACSCS